MGEVLPKIYVKDIFSISYDQLKNRNIKCLVFDLDNTLVLMDDEKCSFEVCNKIKELKKDFLVVVSTNNIRRRVGKYLKDLEVEGFFFSMKPSPLTLYKIRKKYHLEKTEMCIVGDQIFTDILAGNLFSIMTILVDPLGDKEHLFTGISRGMEARLIRKYKKRGLFERGKYYEK